MRVGGVELEGGKIVSLTLDSVGTAPPFDPSKVGTFYFSTDDGILRFNNGAGLSSLNISVSEDPNLIESLGSNWLNGDLSFNPVPFNDLPIIDGLTSNDSLFDVISQIVNSLNTVSTVSLDDIDLGVGANPLDLLVYLDGRLIFIPIEQVFLASELDLPFSSFSNFDITNTDEGRMLSFNGSDKLVSRPVSYEYINYASSAQHQIVHNLGKKYCSVFCINPNTDEMIVPDKIEFVSDNTIVITLSSALPLVALVTNLTEEF